MSTNNLKEFNLIEAHQPASPPVLTLAQVAEKLQVDPITVRRLVWKGVLPQVPHIRHIRITQKALDKFLEGRS